MELSPFISTLKVLFASSVVTLTGFSSFIGKPLVPADEL